jgi:hypothetical protein
MCGAVVVRVRAPRMKWGGTVLLLFPYATLLSFRSPSRVLNLLATLG